MWESKRLHLNPETPGVWESKRFVQSNSVAIRWDKLVKLKLKASYRQACI